MAESTTHQNLVRHILKWLDAGEHSLQEALVYCDLPAEDSRDKPPVIFGFTPDVFCKTHPSQKIIIGEAKTSGDIESSHTKKQLEAFLKYLSQQIDGQLLIAVPWHRVAQARSLVRSIQKATNTTAVNIVFLDQLPG